jgi:arginine N-succinyltransferase
MVGTQKPHLPSVIIRQARRSDHQALLRLARELDSINLPTDTRELGKALKRCEASFRGKIRDRAEALYIFCAELAASRRVVGASLVIGKHGTPLSPHYYLEMDGDERYSRTLAKMFRHTYLRLRYSMDGPTEVGGLIVTRAMRHKPVRIGKALSWVRFLYIGKHSNRFEDRVIAEMMPPMLGNHRNLFWDHFGRPVTGLSFREADRLSTHDKEFIHALFPDSPLYTFLLPKDVREALGAVGEESLGAVRLLEQAGMKFVNHIDPFDGGPYYEGVVAELTAVKERHAFLIRAGKPAAESARSYLIAREDERGFRAVRADAIAEGRFLVAAADTMKLLGVAEKAAVDAVTLP